MLLAPLSFAFGLSMSVACLMRLLGGSKHGRLLATGGVPVGFLAGVAWISGTPSGNESALSEQILYTVLGGACLGILLDVLKAQRFVRTVAFISFVGLCVWVEMGFPTQVPDKTVLRIEFLSTSLVLFISWLTILLILDHHQSCTDTVQGFLVLLFMAIAVGTTALVYRAEPVIGPSLILASSIIALLLLAYPLGTQLSSIIVLSCGGALFGLIQGMGACWPGSIFPLLLASLCLFVVPTARRCPGPEWLQVVWVCLFAVLPVGLSLIVSLSMQM